MTKNELEMTKMKIFKDTVLNCPDDISPYILSRLSSKETLQYGEPVKIKKSKVTDDARGVYLVLDGQFDDLESLIDVCEEDKKTYDASNTSAPASVQTTEKINRNSAEKEGDEGTGAGDAGTSSEMLAKSTEMLGSKETEANQGASNVDQGSSGLSMAHHVWKYLVAFRGRELADICFNKIGVNLQYENVKDGMVNIKLDSMDDPKHTLEDRLIDLYGDVYNKGICRDMIPQSVSVAELKKLRQQADKLQVLIEKKEGNKPDALQWELIGQEANVQQMKDFIDQQFSAASNTKEEYPLSGSKLEFFTASGIKVRIDKGNIVDQKVDVIVNAANIRLQHGSGVAGAIREACGKELVKESEDHIHHHGKLKVGEPTHTTSGKLYPRVKQVVHVAGPNKSDVGDEKECQKLLFESFYNSLYYSNKILSAKSIAIPAISSGIYGVPMKVVAQCSWDALVKFESYMKDLNPDERYLKQIIFINIDDKTVSAMHSSFTELLKQNPDIENKPGKQAAGSSENRSRRLLVQPNEPKIPKEYNSGEIVRENKRPESQKNNDVNNFKEEDDAAVDEKKREPNDEVKPAEASDVASAGAGDDDDCSICKDKITDLKILPCKHKFCKDCIDMWFKNKPSCPDCGAMFGALKGNQPEDGTMTINAFPGTLPGYERYGVIEITYSFRDGIQGKDHPNPGARYSGTMRRAYLPDNEEGQEVLKLLQEAFKARLIFTLGKSVTSGRDNVVTWNDIHHKTSMRGGEYVPFIWLSGFYLSKTSQGGTCYQGN